MRKPSLLVIFLTVFIDLVGFGIVLPLLPRYSEKYGAEGLTIGLIIASFSVMQFFLAPFWGRLSDRIGRRPVLLLSNAGSAASYAMFALAAWPGLTNGASLALLFASRLFGGACGANLSVASAYIADVTPHEGRSKGMGLIGVAFGLGFILGPAIGSLGAKYFGLAGPGWIAALLCTGNFILACFILAESLKPGSETAAQRPKLEQVSHTLRHPQLRVLVVIYFLATFCFACFESVLPLILGSAQLHPDDLPRPTALAARLQDDASPVARLVQERLDPDVRARLTALRHDGAARLARRVLVPELNRLLKSDLNWDAATLDRLTLSETARPLGARALDGDARIRFNRLVLEAAFPAEIKRQTIFYDETQVGYLFAYCGLVSAFIQGGVIGRLVKRFGEPRLIFGSLLLVAASLALVPYVATLGLLLLALGLFAAGSGINRAPTMGLISMLALPTEQGATLGVAQSAGTLARIVGPVFATVLYAWNPHLPYLGGAVVALGAAILGTRLLRTDRSRNL